MSGLLFWLLFWLLLLLVLTVSPNETRLVPTPLPLPIPIPAVPLLLSSLLWL
jgi:hypothetical protein